MTNAIDIQSATRTFGRATALDGVSFAVPEGSICGLLGLVSLAGGPVARVVAAVAVAGLVVAYLALPAHVVHRPLAEVNV